MYHKLYPPPEGMRTEDKMINVTDKALEAIADSVKDATKAIRVYIANYG